MTFSSDRALIVKNVSKCFEMYDKPVHRLFQTLSMGRKTFYKEFWALKDVDFELKRGESLGIIGRNGAGKSTLLQIITGTLQPTTGTVEMKGRVAALLELGSGFSPEFTGKDNVYMNASILGLTKKEIDAKYDDIVTFADIGEFIDQPVKTYSSGMMVRLAFAVQVIVEPDILIVDEALAVGDALFQKKCFAKMMEIRSRGVSLIVVSHDVFSIKQLCNYALLLERGKMVEFDDVIKTTATYYRHLFPKQEKKSTCTSNDLSTANTTAKNDIELHKGKAVRYYDVPTNTSWGHGGITLKSICLSGCPVEGVFNGGEELIFTCRFECDPECVTRIVEEEQVVPRYLFGIRVENAKAVVLADLASTIQPEQWTTIDISTEKEIYIQIATKMPLLAAGNYFFTLGVAVGSEQQHAALASYDNLIMLQCDPNEKFIGLLKFDYQVKRIK